MKYFLKISALNSSANSVEQGARLEKFMKSLNFKQLSFAKAVGISQGYLAQVIAGKKNISYGTQVKLRTAFPKLNIGWLLAGEGEMLIGETAPSAGMVEEGGTRYEAAPAQEEPPPALVVTDVTPLLRLLEGMREEMRAEREAMRERVEWLERRVRELEAAAEKGVVAGL